MSKYNLFATVLTNEAPSSNYHGESDNNRTVIQKILKGEDEFAICSSESIRNALRESLSSKGLTVNRTRLKDQDELTVKFSDYPDAAKFADDFFFGYMMALGKDAEGTKHKKALEAKKSTPKRDSVFRVNIAVALNPYQNEATFHQSPMNSADSPWQNSKKSALLHREVVNTSYQYPFALSMTDCLKAPVSWTQSLISSILELNNVAGNHARSYFEFGARSVVARVTESRVAQYKLYGFEPDGTFPELERLSVDNKALPSSEFWVGGEVVRKLSQADRDRLTLAGVHLLSEASEALIGASNFALGVK